MNGQGFLLAMFAGFAIDRSLPVPGKPSMQKNMSVPALSIEPGRGQKMILSAIPSRKPLALDLCCGLGGWAAGLLAEGWRVVGVDLADFNARYPGEFIRANLLTWEDWRELAAALVVASPPCDEFSRWAMPWTRAKNPPAPSLALVRRCEFIARELGADFILENVKSAQKWLGRSKGNCGPFHLWGDVPAILPVFGGKKKESYGSRQKAERAKIPIELARHIGRVFHPAGGVSQSS